MSDRNKSVVKEVNDAFAANQIEGFLRNCDENVVWRMLGEKTTTGKENIREWMAQMKGMEPPKFTVDEMLADGDSVICRGEMSMKDQSGTEGRYAYCDSYRFANGKITNLDSYVVKLKNEPEAERSATV